MNNVLYIGHYRERSGWGQVTRDQILALDSVGVNVVPRSVNLGLASNDIPQRIIDLEQKGDIKSCDIVIQHVLPHYMKYDSHFRKNIGMFELESFDIRHTQWIDNLNIMDELWVPCSDMKHIQGINRKIRKIPHACDINEYNKEYDKLSLPIENKFVFYFVGTYSRRKHLPALLRAFYTEFAPSEPVELVIKTNKHGMGSEELAKDVTQMCKKIKENLRLYNSEDQYKHSYIITVDIEREEMLRLHHTCDCLVVPSFGEAWCAPVVDAMAMGNLVIAGDVGGPRDHICSVDSGFLVEGSIEPMFGETEALDGFGTAREKEFDISISDLQEKMRLAYSLDSETHQEIQNRAKTITEKYSYNTVGNMMKEALGV